MSYMPLDRSAVKTKDLILDDGQSYDQYHDPMILAARNMLKDIDAYDIGAGSHIESNEGLKVSIPNL
jgi:hypothetical protein